MSSRWKKHRQYLNLLLIDNARDSLLKDIRKEQLDVLSEMLLNIYRGVVVLNKQKLEQLVPFKQVIERLVDKKLIFRIKKKLLLRNKTLFTLAIKSMIRHVERDGTFKLRAIRKSPKSKTNRKINDEGKKRIRSSKIHDT